MMMAKTNGNLFFMKILALVGILSIVYILVNIGYSWNFESHLIRTIPSQEIIGKSFGQTEIQKKKIKGSIPEFIDEKKFLRPIVSEDRYIHDFNYNGTIWPMPQKWQMKEDTSGDYIWIPFTNLKIEFNDAKSARCDILPSAFERYETIYKNFISTTNIYGIPKRTEKRTEKIKSIKVHVATCENYPSENMKDGYAIRILNNTISLNAHAEWGVLRGLETLSQMIVTRGSECGFYEQVIKDFPSAKHRGLLVDTARHYLPTNVLKALITSLSWNKMNVLHWHIVDQQSFSFQSESLPSLSDKGGYTQFNHVYSISEIKDLIEYARLRGIRIIPEFDTPGHTKSWGPGGGPDFLTKCTDYNGKFNGEYGPIDPSKPNNYKIIGELIKEVRQVFNDSYIHLGGDEVDVKCWGSNRELQQWMAENNLRTSELESYWMEKVINMTESNNFKYIVWEESFSNGAPLTKNAVVQVWKGWTGFHPPSTIRSAIQRGYKAMLSAPWYFDWPERGAKWEKDYSQDPWSGLSEQEMPNMIGGEAAIWSEFVDGSNLFSMIYPRLSATAERLWSDRSVRSVDQARPRLHAWNCKLRERGLFVPPNLFNTNNGMPWLGRCRRPFDPFKQEFLF